MQSNNQYIKMTQTPVSKLIVSLGIPTILSMLITNIYNMVDTYFVGILGTSASGAVGVVFGLMAILQAFGFMFGQGSGSIISRKLGSKDYDSASKIASTGFFLALFTGGIIGILGLIFLDPLMILLGSTQTILPYAREYGLCILLSGAFMASSCVLNNILRFEGKSNYAMIGLVSGGILNMIGDPIFMFVFKLGTLGAGISTAFSQMISFGILFYMFFSNRTQSKLNIKFFTKDYNDIINIVTTGFPSMVRQGLGSLSTMLLNTNAAVYGDYAVAAMSIVNRVSNFIFSVGLGMGQGYQPVAAFNYGAKKFSRVKEGYYFTAIFGEVLLGIFAFICFFNAESIIQIFRDDPQVITTGIIALQFQAVSCFFQPFAVCSNMMFQSTGNKGYATLLSALRSGLCFIPLILILPQFLGLFGIQIAQAIADILAFFICLPLAVRFLNHLPEDEKEAVITAS